ncbi:hypothetical protein [Antarctobacter heliothermus]|uniref:Uncharacterized protein n=1 Tax=Antarctobacter heliothermus TaxID=74033 RepID=A0A239MD63_9RHOB|nr:hypothetical protein [Antarctobacter heliothermus]SNT39994.1 hypothetical protein SAMN04488078_11402 [Antarctobacter heliothermus]
MKTITTICTENHPGYPDPLIMTVEVSDDATVEDIVEAVIQLRLEEIDVDIDEIRESFQVHFGREGDLTRQDLIFDWRM